MAHRAKTDDLDDEDGEGIGPQEIDAGPVTVVVGFGAVTTVILIFLTIMFFSYMQGTILETKGLDDPDEKVKAVVDAQKKSMHEFGLVDSAGKTLPADAPAAAVKSAKASIPIETAMAMIVEERTKNPNPKIVPVVDPKKTDAKKDEPKKEEPKKDAKGK